MRTRGAGGGTGLAAGSAVFRLHRGALAAHRRPRCSGATPGSTSPGGGAGPAGLPAAEPVKTTVKPTKCSAAIVALNPYRSLCHRSPAEPRPQGRHRPDEVRRQRQPRPRTQPPACCSLPGTRHRGAARRTGAAAALPALRRRRATTQGRRRAHAAQFIWAACADATVSAYQLAP